MRKSTELYDPSRFGNIVSTFAPGDLILRDAPDMQGFEAARKSAFGKVGGSFVSEMKDLHDAGFLTDEYIAGKEAAGMRFQARVLRDKKAAYEAILAGGKEGGETVRAAFEAVYGNVATDDQTRMVEQILAGSRKAEAGPAMAVADLISAVKRASVLLSAGHVAAAGRAWGGDVGPRVAELARADGALRAVRLGAEKGSEKAEGGPAESTAAVLAGAREASRLLSEGFVDDAGRAFAGLGPLLAEQSRAGDALRAKRAGT
jgi:hypothetical protein